MMNTQHIFIKVIIYSSVYLEINLWARHRKVFFFYGHDLISFYWEHNYYVGSVSKHRKWILYKQNSFSVETFSIGYKSSNKYSPNTILLTFHELRLIEAFTLFLSAILDDNIYKIRSLIINPFYFYFIFCVFVN